MTPKKSEENSTPAEPATPPRTIGSKLFGWFGPLVTRIAARFGVEPRLVKGVLVLVLAVVVIVAIVVPVSVFAQGPAPTATPAAAPTSRPTHKPHTPKPTATDAVSDRSCESFLDPAVLAKALGGSKEVSVASNDLVLAAVGGYDCRYAFGKVPAGWNDYSAADDNGYVDVTVARTYIVSPDAIQASLTPMQCSSDNDMARWSGECNSIVVSGYWWYSLSVRSFAEQGELKASFEAITAELEHALVMEPRDSGTRVVRPFDCTSASTGMPLEGTVRGATEGTNEIAAAASLLAAPAICGFSSPAGEEWSLAVYPRGAAVYEPCTHNGRAGSPLSVDGVASAFAHEYSSGDYSAAVCATDGKSTVKVTRSHAFGKGLGAWDEQVLSYLLVPVFDAIVGTTTPFVAKSASQAPTVSPLAGGDCSTVLDPSTLASLAGGALDAHVVSGNPQLGLVGGIDCDYHFGTQEIGVTGYVRVSVAPSMIVDPAVLSASLKPVECRSIGRDSAGVSLGSACDATVSTGAAGWWYSLAANTDQSEEELQAAFVTITAMLESTLKAVTAPAAVKVVQPFDCWDAWLGDLPWTRSRQLPTGTTIATAAFLVVAPSTCEYFTPDGQGWALTIYPGHVSPFEACVAHVLPGGPPASPIAVDGVTSVLAVDAGTSLLACASDGTSSVRVYRSEGGSWDESTRATLSSLLVPVFAAASS